MDPCAIKNEESLDGLSGRAEITLLFCMKENGEREVPPVTTTSENIFLGDNQFSLEMKVVG